MKKVLLVILAAVMCIGLAACGGNEDTQPTEKSGLIGTFTYSDSISKSEIVGDEWESALRMYGSEEAAEGGNMYCTVPPFDTIGGSRVRYTYDQRLRLKRDFTYSYQYNITLNNAEDWGNDFARVTVAIEGVFSYVLNEDDTYTVYLEDPTAGIFTIYGITAIRPGDIFGWTINSAATYVEDVASELARDAGYSYNRYLIGRSVTVEKTEKIVTDDIFFRDIMNDIAYYCDYTF